MAWTGPLERIPLREARRRYDAGLHIGVNHDRNDRYTVGCCFTRDDMSHKPFDEIMDISRDTRRPSVLFWWAPIAAVDLPPHLRDRAGIVLTREQLESWAGPLTTDELETLHEAMANSSIPDAVATIVAAIRRDERHEPAEADKADAE
ncbi:hypothetical protein [Nonomuraea sp. NPDC049400]|uniref:hypothetical protein n=1 Tax=Nonomuraea sp. NPDC049400 TaxID=3364352 RepID=UPI0037BA23E6